MNSYSEALRELEEIIRKMQDKDCDIDKLTQYTSRAIELMKFCNERLRKTEAEVQQCLQELNP